MRIPFTKREPAAKVSGPGDTMTLIEHLAELRTRIIRAALAVVVGIIVLLALYDQVLAFMRKPYDQLCQQKPELTCDLNFLGPLEGFTTRLTICTYGGIILALPVIMWQLWRFIVPALHAKEKRYAIPFILSSVGLFLLGGGVGVAQAVATRIAQDWPPIKVVGARDGFFSVAEEGGVVAQIRSSGADCLLVARGVPAQDLLIDRYLPLLGVKVALGVGGLFDFVSGRLLRAPVWMRETGLEWAFRLLQEPRRLWRRYLVGNLTFMGRIWLQRAGLRQSPNDSVGARRDHFFAKPSYFPATLPDLNLTIDSSSNGPPGMVARGLAALAIGGIALLGSGMRLAGRRPASGSDPRFSHLIRLRAELAEVVTGSRCWFGIRRRSPAQWSRLPQEWQLILRRQSVGVFHAPAWTDGTEFDEEACAAADVFWAVGSAGTRFWTLVSGVSARIRLCRSVAVGGRGSMALK